VGLRTALILAALVVGAFSLHGIALPAPAAAQTATSAPNGDSGRDVIPDAVIGGEPQGDAVPSMIPGPNSGVAPSRASDRGGALQLGILATMVLAVVLMGLWVRRSGRGNRAATLRRG